jgi:hypothetical protein
MYHPSAEYCQESIFDFFSQFLVSELIFSLIHFSHSHFQSLKEPLESLFPSLS